MGLYKLNMFIFINDVSHQNPSDQMLRLGLYNLFTYSLKNMKTEWNEPCEMPFTCYTVTLSGFEAIHHG